MTHAHDHETGTVQSPLYHGIKHLSSSSLHRQCGRGVPPPVLRRKTPGRELRQTVPPAKLAAGCGARTLQTRTRPRGRTRRETPRRATTEERGRGPRRVRGRREGARTDRPRGPTRDSADLWSWQRRAGGGRGPAPVSGRTRRPVNGVPLGGCAPDGQMSSGAPPPSPPSSRRPAAAPPGPAPSGLLVQYQYTGVQYTLHAPNPADVGLH